MPLKHMNKWIRNKRLYETLLGMGLYVVPVPEEDDATKINHLIVASTLPWGEQASELSSQGSIVPPMEGTPVTETVNTTESLGDNVIRMPPIL
ncbi:MAG: hypothetical protein AAF228_12700 [Pseudomonadota bacterium]